MPPGETFSRKERVQPAFARAASSSTDREPSRFAAAPTAPGLSGVSIILACFYARRTGTVRGPIQKLMTPCCFAWPHGCGLEFDVLALTLGKAAVVAVAGAVGELDGFGEVHADLVRRMGIGAERDGHAELGGEVDNAGAGVDFPAILAQAVGVELDREAPAFGRLQEVSEERRAILPGINGEFLAQVGVADDVKETGFGGLGEALEVGGPDFHRLASLPLGDLGRVIDGPGVGDVMHGSDEGRARW